MHELIDRQSQGRPELILEEAGKLSVEQQEYILAAMRGMMFTRSCILKKKGPDKEEE